MAGDQEDFELDLGEIKKGEYTAEFRYYIDETEFQNQLIAIGEDSSNAGIGSFKDYKSFGKEGIWTFDYAFELETLAGGLQPARYLLVLSSVVFGLSCTLLLLFFAKKDVSRGHEFDERQEIVRGKAFMYGFFIMIVYYGIAALCTMCDIVIPLEMEVLLFVGIMIGILLFACYCVWKDAYFSLNEKKKTLIAAFGIIGLADILIGIYNLLDSLIIENGKMNYRGLPFLCGAMMVVLLITVAVKTVCDRKNEEE